jgi:hypothetical protein
MSCSAIRKYEIEDIGYVEINKQSKNQYQMIVHSLLHNSLKRFSFFSFLISCLSSALWAQGFVEDSTKYGPGKVYTSPEYTASFPGGKQRMYDYIALSFDSFEDQNSLTGDLKQGLIEANFIVEPNGKVQYVEYTQSLSPLIDDEMTRALISMPKWKPAMHGGVAVRSFQTMRYQVQFTTGR